jgi:TonB family protein
MLNNGNRLFVLACFLLTSGFCFAAKEDTVSPQTLIVQARKIQQIWTDGTPPLGMRAEIQIFDSKGATIPGQYTVNWVSPSRWREELRVADYARLRVHDAKGYWQQSTLSFEPEIVFLLDTLLDLNTVLRVKEKQSLGKVKSRTKHGARQQCTTVKWTSGTERVLCFDETSGNLDSVEYPAMQNGNPPEISKIEYSGFTSVGEKRIPFEIRALRNRTVFLAVKVLEITHDAEENPTLFSVPMNSEFWAQCADMQEAEVVTRVQPTYPPSARSNFEHGRVIFYAVVEADGTISHLTLIQRATPALESAAADAIRQWRYKPAACSSTPIRVETSVSADFWLER